jgi:protoporphyrinogen oxidase
LLVLRARRKPDWQELDGANVEDYCLETSGKEAYKLVNYIVHAKFAEPSRNVSAAWLMSRFGHESKSVSAQFGYMNDGIESIISGLAAKCGEKGEIRTNTEIKRVKVKDDRIGKLVYESNGKSEEVKPDLVISTLPIPALLRVAEGLPEEYRKKLENVTYKSSICAAIGLSKRLSPFYWLNIMDLEKHPFVGAFEHGHLNTRLKYPSVMFVVKYLNSTDSFWQRSDEEIVEKFLSHLGQVFDCDVKEHLLWWRLHRAEYSTPLFTPNYGRYMPEVVSPIRGLYIGGISRTYPRDRYMGTALQTGIDAAEAALTAKEQ